MLKISILGSFWDTDDEKSKISNEWRLIGMSKEFERTCFNWGKKNCKT